mgnify:CR=1 FL=1
MSLDIAKVLLFMFLCLLPGILGSMYTSTDTEWYNSLQQPTFQPPGWVFGPVWTVLYIMMGISLYLVWKLPSSALRTYALTFFGIQLVLNGLWTFLFFGAGSLLWSSVDILLLLASLSTTIYFFYQLSTTAAYLLVPYLLWVSFATVLNLTIYYLNPGA